MIHSAFLLLLLTGVCYASGNGVALKAEADKRFAQRKTEEAKQLYLKAAEKGDTQANFDLAHKYNIEPIVNYKIAAMAGHEEALKYYIEAVFYRAQNFKNSDPTSALRVYQIAKKANPKIRLFQERKTVNTLKRCVEAGDLNFQHFALQYGAKASDSAWRWARVVSEQENNPKLTLQLVCRGGAVPAELQSAVRDFYKQWQANKPVNFNGCDYAQSTLTIGMCSKGRGY